MDARTEFLRSVFWDDLIIHVLSAEWHSRLTYEEVMVKYGIPEEHWNNGQET